MIYHVGTYTISQIVRGFVIDDRPRSRPTSLIHVIHELHVIVRGIHVNDVRRVGGVIGDYDGTASGRKRGTRQRVFGDQ